MGNSKKVREEIRIPPPPAKRPMKKGMSTPFGKAPRKYFYLLNLKVKDTNRGSKQEIAGPLLNEAI